MFPIGIYDTCKGHQEQNGQEKRKNIQIFHSTRLRERSIRTYTSTIYSSPPPPSLSLSLSLSHTHSPLSLSLFYSLSLHFFYPLRLQTHRPLTTVESRSEKEGNKIRNLVVVVDFVFLTHLLVVYIPSHLCV